MPTAAAAKQALRCTVLIPAHDEELILGRALASLQQQTRTPERVIVIADNCTDGTAQVARDHGVEVVETLGNRDKKAGALNQQLSRVLPDTGESDVILVMDADSEISREFLEVGLGRLEADPSLMAVGGLFYGDPGHGLVGQFQRNEYTRYQRLVARKAGRVFVLTGTASLVRAYALSAVADARGEYVPGTPGHVYDTQAMTEDNELTFALRTLGAKMTSPQACRVTTEIMPSWKALWRQRLRWHRGALENIGAYGADPCHRPVLGSAAHPGLRCDRPELLPPAHPDLAAGRGRVPDLVVLGGDRPGLPRGETGDCLGRGLESQGGGHAGLRGAQLRRLPPGLLHRVTGADPHPSEGGLELRPHGTAWVPAWWWSTASCSRPRC